MSYLDDISITKLKGMNRSELEKLAKEIRLFLIDKVTRTGGHLASNLGTVELTLALHYVFDSPYDKLLFDVGHQSYTHKILTGRKDGFESLRQYGGISGFPRPDESEHDIFSMGHASNAISVAAGMAKIRDLREQDYSIVAVIGDGALSGGMAMEAINDAGYSKNKIIVVLNDNEMSIAKNVGAMAGFLGKMRTIKTYTAFKRSISNIIIRIPLIGRYLKETISRMKNRIKYLLLPTHFIEEMGFTYIGILDGHDIDSLIDSLKDAKNSEVSVLLHIKTVKGCGCEMAEKFPEDFHGVSSNHFSREKGAKPSNGKIFVNKLIEMARADSKICAITAAMPHGTELIHFEEEFPERFMDVGIAEQHAVTLAAGIACGGGKPYFGVYSTFLQRAYDQIFHDVCLQNLPVTLVIDRAGLVGNDGETHHGVFDLSYLRPLPGMTIMAPATGKELEEMLELSHDMKGPCAIRYSKVNFDLDYDMPTAFGKWKVLREIKPVTIVAVGNMVKKAIAVSDDLKESYGIELGVVNACFVKPMDDEMIEKLSVCQHIFTLEDNVVKGGFGSGLLEAFAKINSKTMVSMYGVPDRFITHGNVDELMKEIGLDTQGIKNRILDELEIKHDEA